MKTPVLARISLLVGILAASIAAADATATTVNTVGSINGNNQTVVAATGNSLSVTVFSNNIITAFANNTGGVWNFESYFSVNVGETITLNYGAAQSSSLVLTLSSGNNIAQTSASGEPTSGSYLMALNNDTSTRVYTPSKPLLAVAIFNSNRGDSSRTCALTVTYMDNTTATTSGANGGAWYFHELSATGTNYIKSFAISQNNYMRYDDMAFIVAPSPAASVGVKFTSNGSGTGADALAATDSAGAPGYAQTNWNNFGRYGSGAVMTNNLGAVTSLSIQWDAGWTDNSGSSTATPDGKLMYGYITASSGPAGGVLGNSVYNSNGTNKPLTYVGNLQAWYQAQGAVGYKVVLYVTGKNYWETIQGYVESVTGSPFSSTMAEGSVLTPPLYATINSTYSGTYTQITSTNSGSGTYGSGYMVFGGNATTALNSSLTNDAVLLRLQNLGGNAGVSGFQIVPVFATPLTSVGVNFVNSSGGGFDNSNGGSLASTNQAGAPGYAQTNWNNLSKWGSGVTLANSAGSATSLFINWDAGWQGSSGTATGLGTPDGKLMDGYLGGNTASDTLNTSVYGSSSQAKPLVYLSGLNTWCLAQGAVGYKVVMYRCDGGGSWETTHGWVQSVTGNPSAGTMVGGADLTPRLYIAQNSTFSGTYKQISTNATSSGNRDTSGGNYCVFSGLTNDAVLIRTGGDQSGWGNGALNGFQIIPVIGPKLTSATASTNTITRGQSILITAAVTAGDNALSSVTVNASAVGGSSSLALVSNGAGSYTNTVAVSVGTAMGSQTLTVNATDVQSFVASSNLVVTVVPENTTTACARTAGSSSQTYGSTLTFTATVTGASTTPTGNVVFKDGSTVLATVALTSTQAVYTSTTTLKVAGSPHSVAAYYQGDSAHNTSDSSASPISQTIAAASLTPVVTLNNRGYDSTTAATTIATRSLSGTVYGSDVVSLTGGTVAAFSSVNVGSYSGISITGLSLTGADSGNYQLSSSSTTASASITQAALTITAAANTKTYDGGITAAATPTVTGLQGSDTVTGKAETYDNQNVGTGKTLTVSAYTVNDGNSGNNYNVSLQTSTAGVINQATPVLALTSSAQTNGYKASVSFTATLPGYAVGSVIFLTNSGTLDTESLSGGAATSVGTALLPRGDNTITAKYAGDANVLGSTNTLTQTVTNHPPAAGNVSYVRNAGIKSLRITISDLLTNVTDVDGDVITLVSVGASTNGVTVTPAGTSYLYYANTNNVNDQFSYTITDGYGGTNSGLVSIVVSNAIVGQVSGQFTSFSGGVANLKFHGIPNYQYVTERSTNLTDWTDIHTNAAASNGELDITDDFGDLGGVPASAYYRLKYQP